MKLDGDLTFTPDYFEMCFEHFTKEPRLGIGGGDIYHSVRGELKVEAVPKFHVRGATKIYRRACWEAIGGLFSGAGWDTIDEVKANMLGWDTYSFKELHLVHHRLTGSADGFLRDRVKYGSICFVCGYHPLYVLARCLYRSVRKPYILGSLAILFGFLKSYFVRHAKGERRAAHSLFEETATKASLRDADYLEVTSRLEHTDSTYVWNLRKIDVGR